MISPAEQKQGIRSPNLEERPSSVHELEALIKRALPTEGDEPRIKNIVEESLVLRKEFTDLVKTFNIPFFGRIFKCEGDLYILILSEFELMGGTEMKDGEEAKTYTELELHRWIQRTYTWQAENKSATWAVFTELALYKYYVELPTKLAVAGVGKEKVKWAPIVWVSASDGQCRIQDDTMRRANERNIPNHSQVIQMQLAYGVNVASKLLEQNKLLVQQADEERQSKDEILRDMDAWAKNVIAKGLEKSTLIEKAQRPGIGGWLVSIFSKGAMQTLMIILSLFSVIYLVTIILSYAFGTPIPFPGSPFDPGPTDPGGGDGFTDVTGPVGGP